MITAPVHGTPYRVSQSALRALAHGSNKVLNWTRYAFLFGLLAPLSPPSTAAVYKCEAADGSISFQQHPCTAGDNQRQIEVPKTNVVDGAANQEAQAILANSRDVANGRVRVGMTSTDVLSAWGSPTSRKRQQTHEGGTLVTIEHWEWERRVVEKETRIACTPIAGRLVRDPTGKFPDVYERAKACGPKTTTQESTETKYVTLMNGVVTFVQS